MKAEDDRVKIKTLLSQLKLLTGEINKLAEGFEDLALDIEASTKKERALELINLVENENDPVFEKVLMLFKDRGHNPDH